MALAKFRKIISGGKKNATKDLSTSSSQKSKNNKNK